MYPIWLLVYLLAAVATTARIHRSALGRCWRLPGTFEARADGRTRTRTPREAMAPVGQDRHARAVMNAGARKRGDRTAACAACAQEHDWGVDFTVAAGRSPRARWTSCSAQLVGDDGDRLWTASTVPAEPSMQTLAGRRVKPTVSIGVAVLLVLVLASCGGASANKPRQHDSAVVERPAGPFAARGSPGPIPPAGPVAMTQTPGQS
jgi:hypothetical protein